MDPTPPSKRRRSGSPSAVPRPSLSPSRPVLPPPTPSAHAPPGLYPAFAPPPPSAVAEPSWQPWGGEGERNRPGSRHSMGARSPMSDVDSARMEGTIEGIDEGSEGGLLFSRDNGSRAPRSMMACTRCRRQKMKCDGPSQIPCRGCRASGQPCIFEARSRPKSISALPSRAPPFQPIPSSLRPGSPTPLPPMNTAGSSGFYPSHSQPAPPITSRSHPPPSESFIMRSAREPLPPAPPTSLSAVASSSYAMRGHTPSASTSAIPTAPTPSQYYNPPMPHLPQITSRPVSPSELRWRHVENGLRSLQAVPANVGAIQTSLTHLQRSFEAIFSVVSTLPGQLEGRAREAAPDISDLVWNSYRSSAWPLTPWLVGLREPGGLPGLAVSFLGKRTLMDRSEQSRRECDDATAAVHAELGRLISERVDWTREEIRALGVFATWTNDGALACLAIGQARMQTLDRILSPRRSHDDWREWIYLSIMDKLSHVPDFTLPVSNDSLSHPWQERLNAASSGDPAVRDRDLKLLAWLEYAESLVEILKTQNAIRLAAGIEVVAGSPKLEGRSVSARPESGPPRTAEERIEGQGKKVVEIWKKWGGQWETWASTWSVRADPILSLHYSYATLFTLSPVFLCTQSVWADLASVHEGFQHLERARDAAFAVVKAICSPEVSRTLPFSFALFRPLLGLAIHTLVSIHIALPNSPIISLAHLTSVLRSTQETIYAAHPLDALPATVPLLHLSPVTMSGPLVRSGSVRPSSRASRISGTERGSTGGGAGVSGSTQAAGIGLGISNEGGLLREMADGGIGRGREVWGAEPGRETWRRLVG